MVSFGVCVTSALAGDARGERKLLEGVADHSIPLKFVRLYGIPDDFLTLILYYSSMNGSHRRHASFLLRLWREELIPPTWRASLEDADTGERKGFATLDMLMEFLVRLTDENQPPKEKRENDAPPTA